MLYNGAAKTATVFQVTVSSLHGVSTKGIDVLQEHPDIQFIDYVLVTPENVPPIKAKVEVPLAIANVIRRYYHLQIPMSGDEMPIGAPDRLLHWQ